MTLPTAKELKKLTQACRSAGITAFEGGGIKFTLSDLPPTTKKEASAKSAPVDLGPNTVESDELTDEQKLFWSSAFETEPAEGNSQ